MEARFEGGQGPEGAVPPYMEWNFVGYPKQRVIPSLNIFHYVIFIVERHFALCMTLGNACLKIYRIIQNDCQDFNNLSYTTHFR